MIKRPFILIDFILLEELTKKLNIKNSKFFF